MSYEADNVTNEERMIMLLREILDELKLNNMILEEVHDTGFTIDDIEEE